MDRSMAQPSVANYFSSRKRAAVDENKVSRARKVLILDKTSSKTELTSITGVKASNSETSSSTFIKSKSDLISTNVGINLEYKQKQFCREKSNLLKATEVKVNTERKKLTAMAIKHKKLKAIAYQAKVQQLLNNMKEKQRTQDDQSLKEPETKVKDIEEVKHVTPPTTPTKVTSLEHKSLSNELSIMDIKKKLNSSSKLAELKKSIGRFKQAETKLEELEKKTATLKSPTLKAFKTIDLEVNLSPQKPQSPEKPYLSPKKNVNVRRNLVDALSPSKRTASIATSPKKQIPESLVKDSLTLPYKYRFLAEVFRAVDTVSQILYNRKETITFKRLKPAVEKILSRNFTEKHLAQIMNIYPEAFTLQQNKMRTFGTGTRTDQWELVVTPSLDSETMTPELLLERRRKLYGILINKLKGYHAEFLQTLDPPIEIAPNEIKRWHPLFDIEKVPDITPSSLPQPPTEEKLTTGQEVLEKARTLFSCNTRMERALQRLEEKRKNNCIKEETKEISSVLKGVPQALIDKVRQKQAAKALDSMTRSAAKEKEMQIYMQLPEIARVTRNLFVAEKRNVLPFDVVLAGLSNSIQAFLNKKDLEEHLKLLVKELPEWLVFHTIRNCTYIKINKSTELGVVMKKLNDLIKEKDES